jgi:hypothetical protein
MYAAQKFADGILNSSDLPDNVTVNGTSFSLSGTGYGNTTNGVILEGNVWAKYTNGVRSSRPCLIQGGVEDQFADTYNLSATNTFDSSLSISISLNRVSLCNWEASAPGGGVYFLIYQSLGSPNFPPLERPRWLVGSIAVGFVDVVAPIPANRLNTPVGPYNDRFSFVNITIS